ncbi:MAG: putative selenium-dependent hydroxylase accessory protein YqeC [Bradymonadales bacterium]|nr:putative selenium-dependent hydroxylase accessory protein YqeC [Bradymonadales bacterium]
MIEGDALLAAFDLTHHRFIHLIGGGGKTTLMLAMARAFAARGMCAIATTSTRIRRSEGEALEELVIGQDVREIATRARTVLAERNPIVLAYQGEAEKLVGFSADQLEQLAHLVLAQQRETGDRGGPPNWEPDGRSRERIADALIVEADGAAGRPLKAHHSLEPVIAPSADLVIVVVGAWCLGQPLDDRAVHRAELFARRLGCEPGTPLEVRHVAGILFHPEGYLARVPPGAEVMLAVTSRGGDDRGLARALELADEKQRLARIVRVG